MVKEGASFSPADYVRCIIPEEFEVSDETPSRNKPKKTEGYTMEAVGAIRSNDVSALRHMLENGHCFNVCTRLVNVLMLATPMENT